jgi:hypothetical protein
MKLICPFKTKECEIQPDGCLHFLPHKESIDENGESNCKHYGCTRCGHYPIKCKPIEGQHFLMEV